MTAIIRKANLAVRDFKNLDVLARRQEEDFARRDRELPAILAKARQEVDERYKAIYAKLGINGFHSRNDTLAKSNIVLLGVERA